MDAGRDGKKARVIIAKKIARPCRHQKAASRTALAALTAACPACRESSRPPGHGPTVGFFGRCLGLTTRTSQTRRGGSGCTRMRMAVARLKMGMSSLIASFASTCTLRRYARGPRTVVVGLVIQHTAEPAWQIGVTILVPAGYCVSAACLDHGRGTGCKNNRTSPLAPHGCCCRAWFPLLENGTTRRTKAARGGLTASFLWRFQAKWTSVRMKKTRQNETGTSPVLI